MTAPDATGVCFVVLAHSNPPALRDQVDLLRTLAPGARVAVFNGGRSVDLTAGLDVDLVEGSRPLRHGYLAPFHALTMEWVDAAVGDYDYLVTLDSDALLVRPGLRAVLDGAAIDGCGYLGAHLGEVLPGTPWGPGRRFLRAWEDTWQPVLRLPHPLRCFNPVQVFTRQYVQSFLGFERRSQLMQLLERTRLQAVEEIVWPSLAATLGLQPRRLPGDHALQLHRHPSRDLARLLADQSVFFVHKVGMSAEDEDRRLVHAYLAGERPELGEEVEQRVHGTSPVRAIAARAKDVLWAVQRRR